MPIRVTIGTGRRIRTSTAPDPCVWYSRAKLRSGPGWRFTRTENILDEIVDDPRLIPEWSSGTFHRLRYSFATGSKTTQSGVLEISMGGDRPIFIYAGSDDFQNYCINRRETIFKRNGRRYCVRVFDDDSNDDYYVRVTRDRKPRAVRRGR